MKKLILIAFTSLSLLCCASVDFQNYDVVIYVKDTAGNNLLNSNFEGNILENDIYVEYDGEAYRLTELQTRKNPAIWYGLRIVGEGSSTKLAFGQFGPNHGSEGKTFEIFWGDGTSNVVKFDFYWTGSQITPIVRSMIWVDGVLKSKNSLNATIVK